MEPVRFADILFILLVCLVTFGILLAVHRARSGEKKNPGAGAGTTDPAGSAEQRAPADEDN